MPSTYTLISSNTLGSSTASVTFSAIPQTYTDLVLRISTRNDDTGVSETVLMRVNGLSTSIYSSTYLYGTGTSALASRDTAQTDINDGIRANGGNATANTFSNNEIYLPNYTGSNTKVVSVANAAEQNATTNNWIGASANLVQTSSAITSITLSNTTTKVFLTGSSFYLYGISKS
jgi:hypothetical protein